MIANPMNATATAEPSQSRTTSKLAGMSPGQLSASTSWALADTPLRFSWTVCASVTVLRCSSLRIAAFLMSLGSTLVLEKNRSRWLPRFFRFHPAGIKGELHRTVTNSQTIYKIRSSSGVSKDKGTEVLRPFHRLLRKANVVPLVGLKAPMFDRSIASCVPRLRHLLQTSNLTMLPAQRLWPTWSRLYRDR
jgi:hypothetical protein